MSGAAVAASLPEMLGRLKLTAMRDRLDGLLDEAARQDLTLPEALALLCAAEVAHREERRIQMGLGIAKFPYLRTLEGFDFAPSAGFPSAAPLEPLPAPPSPRSIPSRSETWPPAAGSPTATRC